ncbi:16S rRNA (guanine(1516)-N(2))-methyltransferase, partial [Klebsiella pneumoniae]|nr:16S rRNA (guanine(1516)-N(2))-methyltransferase [Klebsiella pneumoniae]
DEDADALLAPAMVLAKKRVVVKRPDYAEPLNNQPAHASVTTKNHRFDIYPCI